MPSAARVQISRRCDLLPGLYRLRLCLSHGALVDVEPWHESNTQPLADYRVIDRNGER